jgi:hypothetical protein
MSVAVPSGGSHRWGVRVNGQGTTLFNCDASGNCGTVDLPTAANTTGGSCNGAVYTGITGKATGAICGAQRDWWAARIVAAAPRPATPTRFVCFRLGRTAPGSSREKRLESVGDLPSDRVRVT